MSNQKRESVPANSDLGLVQEVGVASASVLCHVLLSCALAVCAGRFACILEPPLPDHVTIVSSHRLDWLRVRLRLPPCATCKVGMSPARVQPFPFCHGLVGIQACKHLVLVLSTASSPTSILCMRLWSIRHMLSLPSTCH
eukprot:scpid76460/ scgid3792/ 